ncbi:MAG: hypothetical protein EZS28_011942 [Streblomastix strix]|uniref:Tyr recombinase domain-containing protein n=1 Tax=Streblomastix strix TaxID=222440 RepID=A0A5J4WC56_9EUKA|nr:MAG: hypothetical protein EZS28_011942 [Streblomastix strix]
MRKGIIRGWTSQIRIPSSAISDLQWLLSKVTSNKGHSIIPPAPIQRTFTTDASHISWGSTLEYNSRTWIAWENWSNPKFLKLSNQREMKAIHYALMHFALICNKQEIHSIMIRSDNQVAVQDINCRRAAPTLAPKLRQILKLEEDKKCRLEKAGDHQLKKEVLNETLQKLQVSPTLDAFVARRNSLSPRFLSPTDDNRAIETNGLKLPCGKEIIYAHPPIAIIERCLHKIKSEKTAVVSILPDWEQWWNPVVKQMEINSIQLGQADKILKSRKSMKRNESNLRPGNLVAHLIQIGEEMKGIRFEVGNVRQIMEKKRAAVACIASYLDTSTTQISSFFGETAALTVRRELRYCADKKMTEQSICATKQGLCAIIELRGGPQLSKVQILSTFIKKHAAKTIVKAKYKKIWKAETLLNFEKGRKNNKSGKEIQANAAVLLQVCTTLRGSEIAVLNRSSVYIDNEEMRVIAPKTKKRNCFIERIISRLNDKNISPVSAMESRLKVIETKVGDDLWFTTKNKRMNEQQVRDFIRLRLREAGIPKEYGSNTIRSAVITKLRQSGLSLEEVNLLTDHAYGSRVVDYYYFRPEEPLQIGNILEKLLNKTILSSTLQTSPNRG